MTDDFTAAQIEIMKAGLDLAAGDLTVVENGTLTKVHKAEACADREIGCWVHNPSGWPLNQAPVFWDPFERRAYRRCEHGVLHRDYDDWRYQTRYSTMHAGMPPWCCRDESDCACCRAEDRDA